MHIRVEVELLNGKLNPIIMSFMLQAASSYGSAQSTWLASLAKSGRLG